MQESITTLLRKCLISDSLPGFDVRIGYSDGEWHVSQHYCGLDESWPTGLVGTGNTLEEAINDAVSKVKENG